MKMGENDISKNQVRKAGENVRDDKATNEDYKTISLWRSKHISIMTAMVNAINRKLKKVNNLKAIIVARRLKRLSSIEFKLKRFPNMNLTRCKILLGLGLFLKNYSKSKIFKSLWNKPIQKRIKRLSLNLN